MYDNIEFVICAAGTCSRNYPHSKAVAHKALLPMGDKRLIDYPLQDIIRMGGRHITFVCSNQKVIDEFKQALATDTATAEKLRLKNQNEIADIFQDTFLPTDVDMKFVIQDEPLGTAHVLYAARDVIQNRHAVLIFPDDLILSKDPQNPHMKKLVDAFLENPKLVTCTAIWREDVSNNAVLVNNRIIEKPKKSDTHIAAMSPNILPNEVVQFLIQQAPQKIAQVHQTHKEWYYADTVNDFLDQGGEKKGFGIHFFLKDEGDSFLDTGNLFLYEQCQLITLLQHSYFAKQHQALAQKLLQTSINL